jgi:DNA polymerase-3 subunit gamma/tau
LIDKGKTLDFVEIDAASHTGVDNIREEIIEKALYHPTALKKKIYIIDEVHMLSKGAFNALLKIMEEPPEYMTFILATTEIHKIPDTIISRCQVFQFKKFTVKQISDRLQFIAQEEDISVDDEALALIAKLSE